MSPEPKRMADAAHWVANGLVRSSLLESVNELAYGASVRGLT